MKTCCTVDYKALTVYHSNYRDKKTIMASELSAVSALRDRLPSQLTKDKRLERLKTLLGAPRGGKVCPRIKKRS